MVDSVFQEGYALLTGIPSSSNLINVTEIGFFMIGGGTTWQRKKKMKKTKAHEIEEIFSSLLLLFSIN